MADLRPAWGQLLLGRTRGAPAARFDRPLRDVVGAYSERLLELLDVVLGGVEARS